VARRSGGERRAAPALVRRVGQKEAFEDFRQRETSRDELGWGAAMLEVVELRAAAKSNGFSNNLQISDGPAETPHRFVHWSADRHTQFYPAFPYAACLPARLHAGHFFVHQAFAQKTTRREVRLGLGAVRMSSYCGHAEPSSAKLG
jgi:hypothetical protein